MTLFRTWRYLVPILCWFAAVSVFAENTVQRENAKPGNEGWRISEAQGPTEGYASATSVNRGEQIRFYVTTTEPSYTIEIFRMGWYGGAGGRLMLGPIERPGIQQPVPSPDPATGLIECNWSDPYVLTVPRTADDTHWASGAYLVKITGKVSGKSRGIPFVVRDDSRAANHLFLMNVNTWQAYNDWGGKSLYWYSSTDEVPARKVSFNRPYATGGGTGQFLYRWEYDMVRFLEREGYDVSYGTDHDLHRASTASLLDHRSLFFVGHPEYWTWAMRGNAEAARDNGVSLGFFAGNSVYWQIRYEPSSSGDPDRTIVGYKDYAMAEDPLATDWTSANDHLVTTQFRLAPVSRPEAALVGVQYVYDPVTNGDIVIENTTKESWLFAHTNLQPGDKLPKLLGYEVDAMAPSSPANISRVAHSPFFNKKTNKTEYSDMTVYTHTSGATVFSTGSIQWAWGLDDFLSGTNGVEVVPAAQQMTRNVLLRFAGSDAQRDCQFTLSWQSIDVNAGAGSGSFELVTAPNCAWTAAASPSWIALTSSSSGSGTTTISFTYQANASSARSGSITVGGKTFTINQKSGCEFVLSPSSHSVPAVSSTGSFNVDASTSCTWAAVSSAPWLTIMGGATGLGDATVNYRFDQNNGSARTATVTVDGKAVFTLQQASGCVYTIDTANIVAPPGGGSGAVQLTAPSGCFWSVNSHAPWITITTAATGSGSATVGYTVAPNDGTFSRIGGASIAGNNFTVSQSAAGAPSNLVATGTSTSRVVLSWTGVSGAARYDVARSSNGSSFSIVGTSTTPAYVDSAVTPTTAYLYEVRAVNGAGDRTAYSNRDVAVTMVFADDPIVPRVTKFRAEHIEELRVAVNAIRLTASMSAATWTHGGSLERQLIRASDIQDLRNALQPARSRVSLPAVTYSNPRPQLTQVRAADINELRAAVK